MGKTIGFRGPFRDARSDTQDLSQADLISSNSPAVKKDEQAGLAGSLESLFNRAVALLAS